MKIVKWIAIVLLVIVVGVVVVGLMLPNSYELSRSVVIDAQPAQVHALVGDLARWDEWAPWKEADPSVETTLGAQTTGVGASQNWTDKQGGGWLEFTRCDPVGGVTYDMAFVMGEGDDAEEMPSLGAIDYEPTANGTKVTWSMSGDVDMPVFGGYLAKMLPGQVAPMFDRGLAKLKQAAEAEPLPTPDPEPATL